MAENERTGDLFGPKESENILTVPTKIPLAVQNRLAQFEDCALAIDQLFQASLATKGEKNAFDDFLGFMSRFNSLSVYNAMLVRVQRPGAIAVGNRQQWASVNRTVIPDAIPIVVLQAFGPVRFLFEFGDTAGDDIPGEQMNTLFANGRIPGELYDQTRSAAERYGVIVQETESYGNLLAGTAATANLLPDSLQPSAKDVIRYRVRVNAKHDLPTRFATMAHELGHIYCGHLGADVKGRWPDRCKLNHVQMELEAEAVAWLVCRRTGIATRSAEYLSSLATPENIRGVSAYAVFDAANRVEARTPPSR